MTSPSTFSDLDSLLQSAATHIHAGRLHEAESAYRSIIERRPEHQEALAQMAHLMRMQGRPDEAIALHRQALAGKPDATDLLNSLGETYLDQRRNTEAIACFREAMALGGNDLDLHRNLGDALLDSGDPAGALISYQRALQIKPESAPTIALIGAAYRAMNRFDEAIAHFRKALEIWPNFTHAQWDLAWTLLLLGDYARGLPLNERRFDFENKEQLAQLGIWPNIERFAGKPSWDGGNLQGKTLLLWTEQGMGDNVMMMRYIAHLKQKGARSVIVYCHPALVNTMQTMADLVVGTNVDMPLDSFDLHCSMMSLPYLFGTTLQTIPNDVPYLTVPPAIAGKWAGALKESKRLKVGIVWAGHQAMGKDHLRSIDPKLFAPLMALDGIQYVSLQKFGSTQKLTSDASQVLDRMGEAEDFLDTAALIGNLDLVISVDTLVAHLAGALGKPVWLLNRFESEWRWMTGREDSPWYPSMRIFTQPALHDWESVLARVAVELAKLVPTIGVE